MSGPTTEVPVELHDVMRRGSRLAMQRLHHSGTSPARVLIIGDRAHLLAETADGTCADRIADRIWLSTRRGVDLDVLTDLAPVLRAVQGVFGRWRLWRYDVVLVLLAEGLETQRRPRTIGRIGDLLEEVLADAAGATDVIVLGPEAVVMEQDGRSRHAAAPEDRLRDTVARLDSARVRYRALPPIADPLQRVRGWAAAVGEEVVRSLGRAPAGAAATAAALRSVPDDEAARQRALDALHVVGRGPEPRLEDLVELARTAFGTDAAEINFIDRDQQWKAAVSGGDPAPNDRAHSFCALTIQRDEPTVVADARYDPLLRASPLVRGPKAIRFYAAHPIESVEGYRIGSFCVYDHEPRDVEGMNIDVLRDLALLAQVEITGADAPPAGSALRRA